MSKACGSRRIVSWSASFFCVLCAVTVASSGYRSVLTKWSGEGAVFVVEDGIVVSNFGISPVNPFGVALTSDGSILYATENGSGTLSKIDIEFQQVVETITLGEQTGRLAMNAAETRLYVVNRFSDTVSFVDTGSFSVLFDAPAPPSPRSIILGPDEQVLYVGQNGINEPDRLTKLSAIDGSVIDSIELGQGWPNGMALSPDGSLLYLALESGQAIAMIDLDTFTVSETVPLTHRPAELVLHPSGFPLYVASWFDNAVLAVHPQTLEVLDTIEGLPIPAGTDVTPDGSELHVQMGGNFDAYIIDTATFTVSDTITVGGNSRGIGKFIVSTGPPDPVPATSGTTVAILIAVMLVLSALRRRQRRTEPRRG